MDLLFLKSILETNRFYCVYKPKSEELATSILEVLLEDEKSGNYLLQLAYISEMENQIDDLRLLQFFIPIEEFDVKNLNKISGLLHDINISLPLPAFSIDKDAELIYYRYTMLVPIDEKEENTNQIIEVIYLIFYIVSQFSGMIKTQMIDEDLVK